MEPFWPRRSPHFMALRVAVRPFLEGPLTVGLSGGADSLALTVALVAEGAQVEALCVDHGLQPGSHEVAQHAADQARSLGATARVLTVTVPTSGSMEAAARRARYSALADAAGSRPVFIAHTADDAAETLLLSALRGQVTGLAARAQIEGAHVIRPLLNVRRADTEAACAELQLDPWNDPHNENQDFLRVALRTEVIPRLGQLIGGDAVPALSSAAGYAADDNEALTTEACGDCEELAGMGAARRRRAIAAWLRDHDLGVTADALTRLSALCTDWHGQGPIAVPGGHVARKDGKLTKSGWN